MNTNIVQEPEVPASEELKQTSSSTEGRRFYKFFLDFD